MHGSSEQVIRTVSHTHTLPKLFVTSMRLPCGLASRLSTPCGARVSFRRSSALVAAGITCYSCYMPGVGYCGGARADVLSASAIFSVVSTSMSMVLGVLTCVVWAVGGSPCPVLCRIACNNDDHHNHSPPLHSPPLPSHRLLSSPHPDPLLPSPFPSLPPHRRPLSFFFLYLILLFLIFPFF